MVTPEQQPARLVEIAAQYRQLRAQIAALPEDRPEVVRLRNAVRAALDAGRLQQADDLLVQVEAAQDNALDRSSARSSASNWTAPPRRRSALALQ